MISISTTGLVISEKDTSLVVIDQKHSYQAIETILNSLDALVYVSDMQNHDLLYLNDYGTAEWGPIAGRKCFQVLQSGQNSACHFCSNHKLIDKEGKPSGVYVWEFQNTMNGRWYQCRDQAIHWVDGRLVRIEIATDITERKETEQQLAAAKAFAERQAHTDELTQLYNRRAFFILSLQVFHQTQRTKQNLAVIMFDLDHFKQVNDQWNHAAGDAVLVNIAALAQSLVRNSDVLARLGGEEFAIVLPGTNEEQAMQLAERMRAAFAQNHIDLEGEKLRCTASFGISCINLAEAYCSVEPQTMLEKALHSADQAMMQAKVLGRNRVCVQRQD
jgi:diguanylate cyclase (GGDEF)-like protein